MSWAPVTLGTITKGRSFPYVNWVALAALFLPRRDSLSKEKSGRKKERFRDWRTLVDFKTLFENFLVGGVCGACIFPVRSAIDAAKDPLGVEHTKAPEKWDWRLET
jgi:hypothetical protein